MFYLWFLHNVFDHYRDQSDPYLYICMYGPHGRLNETTISFFYPMAAYFRDKPAEHFYDFLMESYWHYWTFAEKEGGVDRFVSIKEVNRC